MNKLSALGIVVGDTLMCTNNEPLEGNKIAPPLEINKEYVVKNVVKDKGGNPHFDVGIASNVAYVTSYETKEELPDGDKVHWCHPSRFEKVYL